MGFWRYRDFTQNPSVSLLESFRSFAGREAPHIDGDVMDIVDTRVTADGSMLGATTVYINRELVRA